jgi:SAM-dependent methyltransferase
MEAVATYSALHRGFGVRAALVALALVLLAIWLQRVHGSTSLHKEREGFRQRERFVAKHDAESFDDFYAGVHDRLHAPERYLDVVLQAVEMTQPTSRAVFLDVCVGASSGAAAAALAARGHDVFALDASEAMAATCAARRPALAGRIKVADAADSMCYDRATFSHILCTNFAIYRVQDKVAFFRNCFFWLRPGGTLILHAVDRDRFDTIVPAARPRLLPDPQKSVKTRITASEIDFGDFKYRAAYDFSESPAKSKAGEGATCVGFTETFTDAASGSVRQNLRSLWMEPDADALLEIARFAGFMPTGLADFSEDTHQHILVLERPA